MDDVRVRGVGRTANLNQTKMLKSDFPPPVQEVHYILVVMHYIMIHSHAIHILLDNEKALK